MTIPMLLFILLALLLVVLLSWAARAPKTSPLSPEQALQALTEERHYARLPQILQCLREDDSEFIRARGHAPLLARLRKERKRIALRYLDYLEVEFRVLLECSRILATLAPELTTRGEFERFRQNLKFLWSCQYLRWRLRLNLQPWEVFGTISDMAGTITLQLEMAATQLGERALLASDTGLVSDQRRGQSE